MRQLENINIASSEDLPAPSQIKHDIPITDKAKKTVLNARETINNILHKKDDRLLVIVGPCSVHDDALALEYAGRLSEAQERYKDQLVVVMRVYIDKPRTTVGWRGFMYDPGLDASFNFIDGLQRTRKLMLDINDLGIPVATEILEPLVPKYYADLLAWVAIGARTTESQVHRAMASGISAAVGFKNATSGNIKVAVDSIISALEPKALLNISEQGTISLTNTSGNKHAHVILRGGHNGTNYEAAHVQETSELLTNAGVDTGIIVDCSHANSSYDHTKQALVARDVLAQRSKTKNIVGIMLESNINEGKQSIPNDLRELKYGVSVTDACIGWDETESLLEN